MPKILVVEDEELIRNIFHQSLENWGYRVEAVSNGKEALEWIRKQDFDIVITDLNMPLMDGMTLLREIKFNWPYIEVIVVTGYGTIESAIEAMKIGAFDFILKPVNFDMVKITIRKCQQKIAAARENTQLRDLNRQLRELNEMKDKFISITNHEIRTPITVIKGYLEILDSMLENKTPEMKEIFAILRRKSRELTQIAERMHILSDVYHKDEIVEKQAVDLSDVARFVVMEMYRLFQHRHIEFKARIPKTPVWVEGMASWVRIILQELLQNALKFTPDKGKVTLKIYETHKAGVICVQDSGIGIPAEKLDDIFKPFYEVQDVVHHKTSQYEFMGGGMGIGLSLVKQLVMQMQGRIEVDSDPPYGSTFVIYLPKMKEKQVHKEVPNVALTAKKDI